MYAKEYLIKKTLKCTKIINTVGISLACTWFDSQEYILWRFMSTILHLFIITSSGLCGGGSRRRYIGYSLIYRLISSSICLFDNIIRLICDCIRISIIHTKICSTIIFFCFQRYTYTSSGIFDNSNVIILVESTISLCGQCNSRHIHVMIANLFCVL